MAEDHQYNNQAPSRGGGGGGGSGWWDSSRAARFDPVAGSSATTTTPTSSSLTGWLTETVDMSMRSTGVDSAASDNSGSSVIPSDHLQKVQACASHVATTSMMVDPGLQIMGLALSSPTMEWNTHSLLRSEKAGEESSFRAMLQEGMGTTTTTPANFNHEASDVVVSGGMFGSLQVQWRTPEKLYLGEGSSDFKQISHMETGHHFNHLDSSSLYSNTPSNILQGLLIPDHHQQQQQQQQQGSTAFESSRQIDYTYGVMPSYGLADNNLLPSWIKTPDRFMATSSSTPKQAAGPGPGPAAAQAQPHAQQQQQQLQFTNNAPYWNASAAGAVGMATTTDHVVGRPGFFPALQQTQLPMPVPTFSDRPKQNTMEVRGESTMKKSTSDQATNKRTRNEASSTLPPFKVRKEKMGDRITALQQLVSPFGKTDTASVLSEAIEYIKFLHQQVNALSTPYLKSGASLQHQPNNEKLDQDGPKQDLRSRGLCLVPVSSTFPVAHETTVDFWTPTFGGTFR